MKVVYAVTWAEDHMGFNEPDVTFSTVDDAYACMTSMPKENSDYSGSWEISPVVHFETMTEYCNFTKEDWTKVMSEHEEIIRQRYKAGEKYEIS